MKDRAQMPTSTLTQEQIDCIMASVNTEKTSVSAIMRRALIGFMALPETTIQEYIAMQYRQMQPFTNFYVDTTDKVQIDAMAKDLGVKRAVIVRSAIQYFMDNNKKGGSN